MRSPVSQHTPTRPDVEGAQQETLAASAAASTDTGYRSLRIFSALLLILFFLQVFLPYGFSEPMRNSGLPNVPRPDSPTIRFLLALLVIIQIPLQLAALFGLVRMRRWARSACIIAFSAGLLEIALSALPIIVYAPIPRVLETYDSLIWGAIAAVVCFTPTGKRFGPIIDISPARFRGLLFVSIALVVLATGSYLRDLDSGAVSLAFQHALLRTLASPAALPGLFMCFIGLVLTTVGIIGVLSPRPWAKHLLVAGSVLLPAIYFALGGFVETKSHELPTYVAQILWGAVIALPYLQPLRCVTSISQSTIVEGRQQ